MRLLFAKHFPRPSLSSTTVALLASLFIVLADNRLFWHSFIDRLGLDTFDHWTLFITMGAALVLAFNVLFSLFAFRPVFKPILILLLLVAAAVSYFSDVFGVVIDRPMIHNILETNVDEASELLTWSLAGHFLLYGIIPASLVALVRIPTRTRKREVLTCIGVVLGSLALIAGLGMLHYKEVVLFGRTNRDLQVYINPYYPVYSMQRVVKKKYFAHAKEPLRPVAADAVRTAGNDRTVFVLALGETARAAEFALNGYGRETNPQLSARDVIDFSDVRSCGTSTAESLPCIFSSLERENYTRGKANRRENILDLLQRLGVTVLWRDNDYGSKGVADRVTFENLSGGTDADLCPSSGNCHDEILLRDLDQKLSSSTGDMMIVLHMKGSHGPSYYKRSPADFKLFTPECTMDNIQDCSRQTIVNAYDNTIVYTDFVLAKLIDLLKAQNFATAMLFVSDHGESLGENGIYLHGLPYALAPDEQTHVPMIFWASDAFIRQKSLDIATLEDRSNLPYSHDFIFHTLLDVFDVKSEVYRPDLDILAAASRTIPSGQPIAAASQRN